MATVQPEVKRLILREIAWSAEESAKTLYEGLKAYARGRAIDGALSGRFVTSTSNAGHSSGFTITDPESRAALADELLRRYDEAVAYLTGSPSDAAILTEMLRALEPVHCIEPDWSAYLP